MGLRLHSLNVGGKAPRVSVVIPNLDGAELLRSCLSSLGNQTFEDFEVLIVDNGSGDGSEDVVRTYGGLGRWLPLGFNMGFPAAANAGIRAARATDYIVLLNNDTRASAEWLHRLVDAMDETPTASFGASKILGFSPPHRIDAAGDGYSIRNTTAVSIGRGCPQTAFDRRAWVFGACAAAAIYRTTLLNDIGLFDEDYFLSVEDVDLDMRAQVAGHRCLYIPDAIVYHRRGASSSAWSIQERSRRMRNHLWTAGKNLPLPLLAAWLVAFTAKLFLELPRLARPGFGGRGRADPSALKPLQGAWSYARAYYEGIERLPQKRRSVRHLRRLSALRVRRLLNTKHIALTSEPV